MEYLFGQWLPDHPDLNNPGLTEAKNCIPAARSYRGMPSPLAQSTNALGEAAQGGIVVKDIYGGVYHYAGTATNLYVSSNSPLTFNNVTNTTLSAYSLGTDYQWKFCEWGTTIIATNFYDDIQYATIGSADKFVSLTAAPRARYCAVVRDFFVVASTFGGPLGDDEKPFRVWWSGINDFTNWPTPGSEAAQAVLSDYQDLVGEGGPITGIVGGEFGVIFKENAVVRMTFGGPAYFQFDTVEGGRGTSAPYSIAGVAPTQIYYWGNDGFYMFNGYQSIPIGAGRVDEFFRKDANLLYLNKMSASFDVKNNIIAWAYVSNSAGGSTPDKIILYSWKHDKWSLVSYDVEVLLQTRTAGLSLDDLDALYPNIDAMTVSLDSLIFSGGQLNLGLFGTDHMLYAFAGSDMTATLSTSEIALGGNRRKTINKIRPLVDGESAVCSLRVATRNKQDATITYGNSISLDSIDEFPIRKNARYHRFELTVAGGFTDAIGLDILEAVDNHRR